MTITAVALLVVYIVVFNIHSFLAVTHRVNANVLVVEGWINEYAIRKGAEEFKDGSYERVFTTGGPVNGSGGYVNDYHTSASVGAEALQKLGVPADCIQMVPSHVIGRERTYSSAVALREWFCNNNVPARSFNVLTEDAHARRTCLLYRKAFGKNVRVGIISVSNPDYDPRHWWRSSEGVREVIGESIAYVYASLIFHPSEVAKDKATNVSQAGR